MIKFKSILAAAAFAFVAVQPTLAQENDKTEHRTYPSWFVGVQGGGQAILNGYDFQDVVTPIAALQGGAYFSPAFGARLHVNGWKSKEGVKGFGTYKFDYVGANIDVLLNLTNVFSKTDNHVFNVILLGGIGINKAWGHHYNDLPGYAYQGTPASKVEIVSRPHNHVAHSDRIGLMLDFKLNQHLSLNLEGHANHIGSRSYAHEFNGGKDWQLVGMVGLTYTFGKKSQKAPKVLPPAPQPQPEPAPVPVEEAKPVQAPTHQINPVQEKPVPAPAPQPAETATEVFYVIANSTPSGVEANKVAEVAQWLKKHPKATATVKGYADKGTGNATVNEKYARQRAEGVARLLTQKYGIDAARLSVSSYGDTVQPFAENDKNRVVVIVAKEK